MKKGICTIVVCLVVVIACVIGIGVGQKQNETQYLRIHIRANSNDDIDQNVKYEVKNAVVEGMSPLLENVNTFKEAYEILSSNLDIVEKFADKKLQEKGFEYVSKARLCKEEFPTRSYESLTLNGGVYDALIIDLGTGKGDNWWCVVFPPLCFVSEKGGADKPQNIKYKSYIAELIEKLKK